MSNPKDKNMQLTIIGPQEIMYKGEVSLVQMPGKMGSFEVLYNHGPIVALLETGQIKIIDSRRNLVMKDITEGVVYVRDNIITIVTGRD